jgi:hypothetical protein
LVVAIVAWAWDKIKKVPGWIWAALLFVSVVVAGVLKWRSMQRRLTAALERARSAERAIEIEKAAVEEHAKVDADLGRDLADLDAETAERLDGHQETSEAVDAAESENGGGLADLANDHFENE